MTTQTDLLTAKECAAYRRCHVRTLENERECGDGCPYIRIGRRIYYRRSDVETFIAKHVCNNGDDLAAA
ncbi:MAG: helix-turn-helix domain-containing protein [Xanthobacteraceae bacterium]